MKGKSVFFFSINHIIIPEHLFQLWRPQIYPKFRIRTCKMTFKWFTELFSWNLFNLMYHQRFSCDLDLQNRIIVCHSSKARLFFLSSLLCTKFDAEKIKQDDKKL